MDKRILQNFYEDTELEGAGKNEALKAREVLALEKLNDTLKDIQTALSRLTDEVTGRE